MRMRHSHLTTLALLAAVAAGPSAARADLAQASPFLPSSLSESAAKGGPSGPVELRGVMSTSQGTEYCIYDVVKRTSAWVGLNEQGPGFVVKSADPASDSVTVEFQGRTMNLVLRTAKVASAGSAAPVANPQGGASAITQTVVLNPTPADEQRRLDAVAAEVRRRRMEREKAAQDAQAGAGGAPAVPSR
jgi:hypothetical protein